MHKEGNVKMQQRFEDVALKTWPCGHKSKDCRQKLDEAKDRLSSGHLTHILRSMRIPMSSKACCCLLDGVSILFALST